MRRRILLNEANGFVPDANGRGIIDGYEAVDLGLSVLWATCDVGASGETIMGKYYKYGLGATEYLNDTSAKYKGTESPLNSSADTATQVMGGGWRMPTRNEVNELKQNTTFNNINSQFKLTSKTNENRFLIFPAGGGQYKSGNKATDTQRSYYWTASYMGLDSALGYESYSYNLYQYTNLTLGYGPNTYGMRVRGVHDI